MPGRGVVVVEDEGALRRPADQHRGLARARGWCPAATPRSRPGCAAGARPRAAAGSPPGGAAAARRPPGARRGRRRGAALRRRSWCRTGRGAAHRGWHRTRTTAAPGSPGAAGSGSARSSARSRPGGAARGGRSGDQPAAAHRDGAAVAQVAGWRRARRRRRCRWSSRGRPPGPVRRSRGPPRAGGRPRRRPARCRRRRSGPARSRRRVSGIRAAVELEHRRLGAGGGVGRRPGGRRRRAAPGTAARRRARRRAGRRRAPARYGAAAGRRGLLVPAVGGGRRGRRGRARGPRPRRARPAPGRRLRTRKTPVSSSSARSKPHRHGADEGVALLQRVVAHDGGQLVAQRLLPLAPAARGRPARAPRRSSLGAIVRSRPTIAACSSASRLSALAISTGCTSLRNARAKTPLTARSMPFSKRSRTPTSPSLRCWCPVTPGWAHGARSA